MSENEPYKSIFPGLTAKLATVAQPSALAQPSPPSQPGFQVNLGGLGKAYAEVVTLLQNASADDFEATYELVKSELGQIVEASGLAVSERIQAIEVLHGHPIADVLSALMMRLEIRVLSVMFTLDPVILSPAAAAARAAAEEAETDDDDDDDDNKKG